MMKNWSVMFTGPDHREELVAEINFKNYQVVEVFREGGKYCVQLRDKRPAEIEFMEADDLIKALTFAVAELRVRLD